MNNFFSLACTLWRVRAVGAHRDGLHLIFLYFAAYALSISLLSAHQSAHQSAFYTSVCTSVCFLHIGFLHIAACASSIPSASCTSAPAHCCDQPASCMSAFYTLLRVRRRFRQLLAPRLLHLAAISQLPACCPRFSFSSPLVACSDGFLAVAR